MKKFKEWYHNGGEEVFAAAIQFLGIVLTIFVLALIGAFIRNMPLFFEYVAKTLVDMGTLQ